MTHKLIKTSIILVIFMGLMGGIRAQAAGITGQIGSEIRESESCESVSNTPFFTIIYGGVTSNSEPAAVGSVVRAYSPRDDLVGCYEVTSAGSYGAMYIYGEDTSVSPSIPGMRTNEEITFTIDDVPAETSPEVLWVNDKDIHMVDLSSIGIAADFTATPLNGISPLTVQFSDNSSGDVTSWLWDFGDGQTSSSINPQHVYTTPGIYSVSLSVSGVSGSDTKTKSSYIRVYEPVIAAFSEDKTQGIAPTSIAFTNTSTGDFSSVFWNFGDGTTSTSQNPIHSFTSGGIYSVTLTVSGLGGTDIKEKLNLIQIFSPVNADFTSSTDTGVHPLSVDFSNASSGDYDTIYWDFGDGSTSSEENPNHIFSTKGNFTVTLTVSGSGGTDQKSILITVYNPVSANFSATPITGIAPLSVTFTNQSSGDYSSLLWDFGDGTTSTLLNPIHSFTEKGSYTISLVATGPGGTDELIQTDYINVYSPAEAAFTASPTAGSFPLTVQFNNTSTGDYDTYLWNFGDGTNSTEPDPVHEYAAQGVYNVSLTINGSGGQSQETKLNYITVYAPVIAEFSAMPTEGQSPLTVDFTNLSSGDFDSFLWEFGDSNTSDLENPTQIYNNAGTYSVSLTVSGPGGTDTLLQTDLIVVTGETVVDFSSDTQTGIAPELITFYNNSTEGEFLSFSWNFGDGSPVSLEVEPTHVYSTPGVYTVTLTGIQDDGELQEIKTDYITIYEAVTALFSYLQSVDDPFTFQFTNESSGDYSEWLWDFGDSTPQSTEENPMHTYALEGTYEVSLTVSGNGGTDTYTLMIDVSESIEIYLPIIIR